MVIAGLRREWNSLWVLMQSVYRKCDVTCHHVSVSEVPEVQLVYSCQYCCQFRLDLQRCGAAAAAIMVVTMHPYAPNVASRSGGDPSHVVLAVELAVILILYAISVDVYGPLATDITDAGVKEHGGCRVGCVPSVVHVAACEL